MLTKKEDKYLAMVECAMWKRKLANALLEEAERELREAREFLGDDWKKEETT